MYFIFVLLYDVSKYVLFIFDLFMMVANVNLISCIMLTNIYIYILFLFYFIIICTYVHHRDHQPILFRLVLQLLKSYQIFSLRQNFFKSVA